jgi:hypothetical protein
MGPDPTSDGAIPDLHLHVLAGPLERARRRTAIIPGVTPPAPLLIAMLAACNGSDPVLQGVPNDQLLSPSGPAAAAAPAGDPEATPDGRSANPEFYTKAPNVWVDVNHLAGKQWSEVRTEAADQLGPLAESVELPGDNGAELRFARGSVRIVDDRVYMMRVPLPEPMRRGPALEAIGMPPYTGGYLIMHREYRLNNERGFRRVRMRRLGRDSELVSEVEAWRWIPGEHGNRR